MAKPLEFLGKGVQLKFLNFSGRPGPYNDEGQMSFAIELDEEIAQRLKEDGWNVKWPKDRELEEGEVDTRTPYISVAVSYRHRPPKIVMETARARTIVPEDCLDVVDMANIAYADVAINGSRWRQPDGSSGIKAYLETLFVVLRQNELDLRYEDVEAENAQRQLSYEQSQAEIGSGADVDEPEIIDVDSSEIEVAEVLELEA